MYYDVDAITPHMIEELHVPGGFITTRVKVTNPLCCTLTCDQVYITSVKFAGETTVVNWSDGTSTYSKCHPNDDYDIEKGLMVCILKKVVGASDLLNTLGLWAHAEKCVDKPTCEYTLSTVRKYWNKKR